MAKRRGQIVERGKGGAPLRAWDLDTFGRPPAKITMWEDARPYLWIGNQACLGTLDGHALRSLRDALTRAIKKRSAAGRRKGR